MPLLSTRKLATPALRMPPWAWTVALLATTVVLRTVVATESPVANPPPIELPEQEGLRRWWARAPGYAWASARVDHDTGGVKVIDTASSFIRGDANRDHAVDISDPIFTLNFLFLGGAALPAPYPIPPRPLA